MAIIRHNDRFLIGNNLMVEGEYLVKAVYILLF